MAPEKFREFRETGPRNEHEFVSPYITYQPDHEDHERDAIRDPKRLDYRRIPKRESIIETSLDTDSFIEERLHCQCALSSS